MIIDTKPFQKQVLKWFEEYGRKDLPWQKPISPYRVWISEIMLQQTQVNTVIPYFHRFLKRFPTVQSLANAPLDDVLHLWAGLGYYARARNMHRTAKIICEKHQGAFPEDIDILQNLPGIGKSTAGAILSFSMHKSTTILDGNIKRLFARLYAINQPLSENKALKLLWEIAEQHTPTKETEKYNQALMDLGALICTRTKPLCESCPFINECQAYRMQVVNELPKKKQKKEMPTRTAYFLILKNKTGKILLEKRPPAGIWGGLWCFPICDDQKDIKQKCKDKYGYEVDILKELKPFRHTFSHFHLDIYPVLLTIKKETMLLTDNTDIIWHSPKDPLQVGTPKPINQLFTHDEEIS